MKFCYDDFDLSGVRTYPLASRKSKANAADFAKPFKAGSGVRGLIDAMPSILAAADFKAVVAALRAARDGGHGIIWGLGAHVIKTGLSPVLVDLMERGFVSAIATNGAGSSTTSSWRCRGATSEDVDEALGPGRFGMAEETGRLLNDAINDGVRDGLGLGQAVALTRGRRPPYATSASSRRRRASRSPSRCTSRSAPTSFTCTPTRRAPRSARAASATSGTSCPTSRASNTAST